jgi:opacity protein-like surface antigen
VVADVSGYGGTGDVDIFPEHARIYNYLFGPQVTARHIGPFNVFVRGLAGTTHARISFNNSGGSTCPNGTTSGTCSITEHRFAYGVGGGIDLNATDHISLRLVQIDYLRNSFTNCNGGFNTSTGQCTAQAGRQDNYRAAAGFVWHF